MGALVRALHAEFIIMEEKCILLAEEEKKGAEMIEELQEELEREKGEVAKLQDENARLESSLVSATKAMAKAVASSERRADEDRSSSEYEGNNNNNSALEGLALASENLAESLMQDLLFVKAERDHLLRESTMASNSLLHERAVAAEAQVTIERLREEREREREEVVVAAAQAAAELEQERRKLERAEEEKAELLAAAGERGLSKGGGGGGAGRD